MGNSVLSVTDFPNRQRTGRGTAAQHNDGQPGSRQWTCLDNSTLSPSMQNSTISVLLFHIVLLVLSRKWMLFSFYAFRTEKHLGEDVVGIVELPVHRGLLLLKCLICNGCLGLLDLSTCKGEGNPSEPCNGLQQVPVLRQKPGFAGPIGSWALLVLELQPQEHSWRGTVLPSAGKQRSREDEASWAGIWPWCYAEHFCTCRSCHGILITSGDLMAHLEDGSTGTAGFVPHTRLLMIFWWGSFLLETKGETILCLLL